MAEPLSAEEKRRYNERWGLAPDACNCHHGSARYCPHHTQADYDATLGLVEHTPGSIGERPVEMGQSDDILGSGG